MWCEKQSEVDSANASGTQAFTLQRELEVPTQTLCLQWNVQGLETTYEQGFIAKGCTYCQDEH